MSAINDHDNGTSCNVYILFQQWYVLKSIHRFRESSCFTPLPLCNHAPLNLLFLKTVKFSHNEKENATTFNRNDDGEDDGSFSSSFSERGGCGFVVVEIVRVMDGRRGCLSRHMENARGKIFESERPEVLLLGEQRDEESDERAAHGLVRKLLQATVHNFGLVVDIDVGSGVGELRLYESERERALYTGSCCDW